MFVLFILGQRKCAKGYFSCLNNKCINETLKCNGQQECEDGFDEKDCPCIMSENMCMECRVKTDKDCSECSVL